MLPALCLIPLVALLRVLLGWQTAVQSTWLVGFTPLSAVALCAGAYLPRRWSLVIPLGILLISDWMIDRHLGAPFWTVLTLNRYVLLALIVAFGMWLQGSARRGRKVLIGTVLSTTVFYLVSNALSWWGSTLYPQNAAGLFQAVTVGLPGYLPSYYFYRNALVSDLLFSILFVACVERSAIVAARSSRQVRSAGVAAVG